MKTANESFLLVWFVSTETAGESGSSKRCSWPFQLVRELLQRGLVAGAVAA